MPLTYDATDMSPKSVFSKLTKGYVVRATESRTDKY